MNRAIPNVACEYPIEIRNIATPLVFFVGMNDFTKKTFGESCYNKETGIYLNFITKSLNHKIVRKKFKEISDRIGTEGMGLFKSNWFYKHTSLIPSGCI
jgi:hypothetical protein